jgi:pantetheine-phosphate adenylyltransferase
LTIAFAPMLLAKSTTSVENGSTRTPSRSASARSMKPTRSSIPNSALADLDGVRVEPFSTLVVDFARSIGAKAIVKGLRAISDFEYELEMNQLNRRQDPEIESVYLMASPQYSFLSSSGVKELATFGGRIDDLVPDEVAKRLQEELTR